MHEWTPLLIATVAAIAALIGYLLNSYVVRRSERLRHYAEALNAVGCYRQLPLTFRRLHDGTPEMRTRLATLLGDTQVSLAYHRVLLTLDSRAVGAAYDKLIEKIREKNSAFRLDALSRPPASADVEIELGEAYDFEYRAEQEECIRVMSRRLRLDRGLLSTRFERT